MNWFNKNKVLIIGLLSAILLAANELFVRPEPPSVKALLIAGLAAAASFLANNLRGQWASIAGIVGTCVATYITMETTGSISWPQLILQLILGLLAIVSPPPKARSYEHDENIVNAKSNTQ